MDYSLLQKIKMWLCHTVGHNRDLKKAWYGPDGTYWANCKRCKHIVDMKENV